MYSYIYTIAPHLNQRVKMIKKIWHLLLGITPKRQYLFWYRYKDSELQNFGDLIGVVLLETFSGITVKHIDDRPRFISSKYTPHYLMVGSILREARKSSIVWGSGIINTEFGVDRRAEYLAVRGPRTRKKIIDQGGSCPEIYGDPALLLPLVFPADSKKKEKITIVPHYLDYQDLKMDLVENNKSDVVNMFTADFKATLSELNCSNLIISSSLHGLILAVAYGIPCLWVEFSDKIFGDDTKYYDFFESLGISGVQKYEVTNINEFILRVDEYPLITATPEALKNLQKGLLDSYPFKIKSGVISDLP